MCGPGFRSPDPTGKQTRAFVFRFTKGQPLGYYSSWPLFILTHHMVVWLVANRVYPGKGFWDYAILGDDTVIADSAVAQSYLEIMAECEVTISAEKSLISHRGACEFAKRFMVEGLTKDLSPISLRVLWALPYSISAVSFANLGVNLQVAYRLRGASYRSYSHLGPPRSRRWRRFWLLMHSAAGISPLPVLIWLAFPEYGGMDCYQIGMVRQFIIERVQPKDFNEVEHTTTEKCLNPTTTCARVALIRVVVHLNSAATALV